MIDRNEQKAQIERLPEVEEFPEELLSLSLEEKLELLRMLEGNHIPAAKYKAAER